MLTLLLALLAVPLTHAQAPPDHILRVNKTLIYSDCTPRLSAVVNGTSPGPLLNLGEGNHYWIRVYNDMPNDNLTMHWHGFTQYGTPFSDGTPGASQWPIPPNHFFDYEFQLEPGFIGTYFYHSHVGLQALTAQGPIIINPANESLTPSPVQYDEDLIMTLGEAYHKDDQSIINGVLNDTLFTWIGEPQAITVNGHVLATCNASAIPINTNCSTTCGWDRLVVQPGKKYRLRVIGSTVLSQLSLRLEGHNMTLFEVDGTYIDPVPTDHLEIHTGQRYSVLIETASSPSKSNYWFNIESIWRAPRTFSAAIWSYDTNNTAVVDQTVKPADLNVTLSLPNETFGWIADTFSPFNKTELPPSEEEVSRLIVLVGDQLAQSKGFRWVVNDVQLFGEDSMPSSPFLVQYYSNRQAPDYDAALSNGGEDPINHIYPARIGEVLDIVVQNKAGPTGFVEAHPWHFHGDKYWDMGIGSGNFSYQAYDQLYKNRTTTPILRDTSVVYAGPGASYAGKNITAYEPGGWRLFRLKVQTPGAFLIHCHITPHMVMGMQTLLLSGAEDIPEIPSEYLNEYLNYGGGAFGNSTYEPQRRSYYKAIGRG